MVWEALILGGAAVLVACVASASWERVRERQAAAPGQVWPVPPGPLRVMVRPPVGGDFSADVADRFGREIKDWAAGKAKDVVVPPGWAVDVFPERPA